MSEHKSHCLVKQMEQVPVYPFVVYKYGFVCTSESGKSQQVLRIMYQFLFGEQYGGCIFKYTAFKKIQFFKYDRNFVTCRFG